MKGKMTMLYRCTYKTPKEFDDIILESDGKCLTALIFNQNNVKVDNDTLPIFNETCNWLDIYFSGKEPTFTPKYRIDSQTEFRKEVIDIMLTIPYGKTITYGEIANKIAKKHKIEKMSSQAVGNAVGWNPICIIIPCHRVIGKNNSLTGYGGGMNNKVNLLKNENIDIEKFSIPKEKNKATL